MKKMLSIILALVLVLALLPASALAYTYNTGNQVYLDLKKDFGGTLPAGETLWTADDFDNVPTDFAFQANWYLGGQLQPAGSKFQAGYTYELRLVMDSNAGSYTAVFENDGWAVVLCGGAYSAAAKVSSDRHAEASFNFTCQATINELSITNIEMPLPGGDMQTEGFTFGPGSGMKQKGVHWYRTSNTDVPIPVSGSFEAGKTYRLELTVGAPAGKIFNLTQNDVAAELGDLKGFTRNSDTEITVRIDFDVPAADKVSSVGISIPAPAVGEFASFIASVNGAGYGVNESFYDDGIIAGISWREGTETIPKGTRFQAGKSYELVIYLIPEPGYEFISDKPNGYSDAVSAKVNGNTAESWGTETSLRVTYTFPALPEAKTEIDGVSVTVTKPAAGKTPVYSAAPGLGGQYTVDTGWLSIGVTDGVGWSLMNSKPWNDIDQPMTASDKFQVGEIYMVCFKLKPNSGYSFADSLVSDPSKALVNGYGAAHVKTEGDGIIVYYVFPPAATAKKEITKVELTATWPKLGEKANLTAMLPADANYTLSGGKIGWFCDEDNAMIAEGAAFEAKTYILSATLEPKEGYSFAADPELSATLNGESVSIWTGEGGKAFLKKYVTLGLENPFTDVKESDYFYNAVMWAYYADPQVTKGMTTTEFGPKSSVTRGQAVTFLWRAMGCPEPTTKKNPFEDVPEDEYYYKAVLWAVEKGITKGTDDTHFTPAQTCSTAHILTFLYRTLEIGTDGWYEVAEAWAKGAGLLEGLTITVAPGVECPRSDVVLFLYRTVGK